MDVVEHSSLSRRSFLKGGILGVAGIATIQRVSRAESRMTTGGCRLKGARSVYSSS